MALRFISFHSRQALIGLLAIVLAMALIVDLGLAERREAEKRALQDTRRIVELASLEQVRLLRKTTQVLAQLSARAASKTLDQKGCSALFGETWGGCPHISNLGLLGVQGRSVCSAVPLKGDIDWIRKGGLPEDVPESGGLFLGLQPRGGAGNLSIALGRLLGDRDQGSSGIVFAALDMTWLSDFAERIRLPGGATLTIVDLKGTILARYPEADRWVGRAFPEAEILQAVLKNVEGGEAEAAGIDGVTRLYSFRVLRDPPQTMAVYAGIPSRAFHAGIGCVPVWKIVSLGFASVLVLVAVHAFGVLVEQRRGNLAGRAPRGASGGDMHPRVHGGAYPGVLMWTSMRFDQTGGRTTGSGRQCERIRQQSRCDERFFETLVEQIPVVIYRAALDRERTILYMSPQIYGLLGIGQEAFCIDPELWLKQVHPEDSERVLLEACCVWAEAVPYELEYRMITADGSVKWVRDEGDVVLDESGEPLCLQGVLIDITGQRLAEDVLERTQDLLRSRVEEKSSELERSNEELRQNAEALKFFAYSVVHDLKSPAVGVHGLTRLLHKRYGTVLDEKGNRYCSQIMRTSEHIVKLVEKINVFIATKEAPMVIETFSVKETLAVLREEYAQTLAERDIRWQELTGDIAIEADRLSIIRAFRNYVDNALKYGGEKLSAITIAYQGAAHYHVFSVSDDGLGLNEKDSLKVFEIFHRNRTTNGPEGVGLGLAIVKEVAERHGGQAWVEPGGNGGATFHFSIAKGLSPGADDDSLYAA